MPYQDDDFSNNGQPQYDSPAGGQPPQFDTQNGEAVANEGIQHINDVGQQQQESAIPGGFHKVVYSRGPDGRMTVTPTMDEKVFQMIGRWTQMGQQSEQIFNDAQNQIAAKQKFLQDNPAIAGIGAIASRAALNYQSGALGSRTLPITHSLGAFGASFFGESPQELAIKNAQLSQEGIKAQQPIIQGMEAAARLQATRTQFLDREDDRKNSRNDRAIAPLMEVARKGGLTPEMVKAQMDRRVESGDMTPQQAQESSDGLNAMQASAMQARQQAVADLNEGRKAAKDQQETFQRSQAALAHTYHMEEINSREKQSAAERGLVGKLRLRDTLIQEHDKAYQSYEKANGVIIDLATKIGMPATAGGNQLAQSTGVATPGGNFTPEDLVQSFSTMRPSVKDPRFSAAYGVTDTSDPKTLNEAVSSYNADKKMLNEAYGAFKAYGPKAAYVKDQVDRIDRSLPKEMTGDNAIAGTPAKPPAAAAPAAAAPVLHQKSKSGKPMTSTDGGKTWQYD